jgi:choline kinase
MVLGVDTAWLERYRDRTDHPPDDAEKVTVANGCVTRIHRQIAERDAHGEYIGVAKFSAAGAARLREHYRHAQSQFAGRPWREARVFEKAYKILLFQEMIERGERFSHVDTPGGYIEVDTQQDFDYARQFWTTKHMRS